MADFSCFLIGDRIVPVAAADRERWGRIPRGPELRASIRRPRSGPQDRMGRKLIASVTEAFRDGPDGMADVDDETTLTMLQCATGRALVREMTPLEKRVYGDGPVVAFRQSTRFSAMTGDQFTRTLDGWADFLARPEFGWLSESEAGRDALSILRKMRRIP